MTLVNLVLVSTGCNTGEPSAPIAEVAPKTPPVQDPDSIKSEWKTVENSETSGTSAIPDWPGWKRIGGFQVFEGASELWIFLDVDVLLDRPGFASPPSMISPLALHTFVVGKDGVKEQYESSPKVRAHPNLTTLFRFRSHFFAYDHGSLGRSGSFYLWTTNNRFGKLTTESAELFARKARLDESFEGQRPIEKDKALLETSQRNGFKRIAAETNIFPNDHEIVSKRFRVSIKIQCFESPQRVTIESVDPSNKWKETLLEVDPAWKNPAK